MLLKLTVGDPENAERDFSNALQMLDGHPLSHEVGALLNGVAAARLLAGQPAAALELSLVGQNLLHRRHVEFGAPASRHEIERGVYGRVAWHF